MAKLAIQLLGQRDSRWASILLGYNTQSQYNIGLYGCLITCFSMYINSTPDKVNQLLKDNEGFTPSGGDFIWSQSTVLGLNQTYISPRYTGPVTTQGLQKIKDAIDNGFPLVCEIDFNPATIEEEQHYVLLTGYEGDSIFANDPWTAQYLNLDAYGGSARTIIQFRIYDKKILADDGSSNLIKQRADAFVAVASLLNKPVDKDVIIEDIKNLIGLEDKLVQSNKALDEANNRLIQIQLDADVSKQKVDELTYENNDLQKSLQALTDASKIQADELVKVQEKVKELQDIQPVSKLSVSDLVGELIKRIFNR